MPEVGTYFDLVLNQKVPADKAMVQAFDMTPLQMEQAVKTYFNSLPNLGIALDQSKKPIVNPGEILQPDHFPAPLEADDVGMAVTAVPEAEAKALLGDMMARIPERRVQALKDLQQLILDPKDNEVAHRALARDDLQQKLFDRTAQELDQSGRIESARSVDIVLPLGAQVSQGTGDAPEYSGHGQHDAGFARGDGLVSRSGRRL